MSWDAELAFDNPRALARALTVIETGGEEAEALLRRLRPRAGRAHSVGLTGGAGVGKSTLVQAMGVRLLERGERVAALAVDPSSPFSGGALLGDRIRMGRFIAMGGFVRSMATRGAVGGLAAATTDAMDVLDAAGFSWLLLETVGVGQDEIDVAGVVDTVVVVGVPGTGDDVQTAKAGLLEVADILVVNKSDLPGAAQYASALAEMLELRPASGWQPPLVMTQAIAGEGVGELVAAVEAHRAFLERDGRREEVRRQRAARRVAQLLGGLVQQRLCRADDPRYCETIEAVASGALDPYTAARRLLGGLANGGW